MKSFLKQLIIIFPVVLVTIIFSFCFITNDVHAWDTASGTIVSKITDTGGFIDFGKINWASATSASSTITVKVRTATSSNMSTATAWASCNAVTKNSDISSNNCVTDGQRYIQYFVYFESTYRSTSTFYSVALNDVTIYYNINAYLESSYYDTEVTDAKINTISWTGIASGTSKILFQIRTAPSIGGTWTSYLGTSTASSYYASSTGGSVINSLHKDGTSDRYIQYKVYLISDGTYSPVLKDVNINYEVKIPVITSISPTYITAATSGVAIIVNGSDFVSGATVTFTNGSFTVTGSGCSIASTQITGCTFDFANLPAGRWSTTVTNTNGGTYTLSQGFIIQQSSGYLISRIKDFSKPVEFGTVNWVATTTATSTVVIRVRSSNSATMVGAPAWSGCSPITNGNDLTGGCVTDGHRYLQYYAVLTTQYATSSAYATPMLASVINEGLSYATGTLISSPYDTEDVHNVLYKLTWTEDIANGSNAMVQIRTAPDNSGSTWSNWFGPTGTNSYYSDPTGNDTINSGHRDGHNDRWVQYQVTLVPNALNKPIFYNPNITYITASTTPEITTLPIEWKGSTVVKVKGVIDTNGPVSVRGFKYDLNSDGTDAWEKAESVYKQSGPFEMTIENLQPNTTYYFRAFAVNARGTSYGEYLSFTTEADTTLNPFILRKGVILKGGTVYR